MEGKQSEAPSVLRFDSHWDPVENSDWSTMTSITTSHDVSGRAEASDARQRSPGARRRPSRREVRAEMAGKNNKAFHSSTAINCAKCVRLVAALDMASETANCQAARYLLKLRITWNWYNLFCILFSFYSVNVLIYYISLFLNIFLLIYCTLY